MPLIDDQILAGGGLGVLAPAPESSPLGMLATLAISAGLAVVGLYALDLHHHVCESCGNKWRHLGALSQGDPKAHTCSRCQTVQWIKDGVPHVFREVLRAPPPKVLSDAVVSRLKEIGASPRLALNPGTWLQGVLR